MAYHGHKAFLQSLLAEEGGQLVQAFAYDLGSESVLHLHRCLQMALEKRGPAREGVVFGAVEDGDVAFEPLLDENHSNHLKLTRAHVGAFDWGKPCVWVEHGDGWKVAFELV